MINPFPRKPLWRGRRFSSDQSGIAIVEFAVVAPLLLFAYLAATDLTQALAIDRKLGALATTVSDLAAQENTLSSGRVEAFFDAAQVIMRPFAAGQTGIQLTVVKVDGTTTQVTGVAARNWDVAAEHGNSFALPDNLRQLADGRYVVIASAQYHYQPLFGTVFNATTTLEQRSFHVVRQDVEDFGFGYAMAP